MAHFMFKNNSNILKHIVNWVMAQIHWSKMEGHLMPQFPSARTIPKEGGRKREEINKEGRDRDKEVCERALNWAPMRIHRQRTFVIRLTSPWESVS